MTQCKDGSIHPDTWLVSAGRECVEGSPLNVPLVPASNFIQGAGRFYSREDGTPTWEALEAIVGGLEGGTAVAFASGMAAVAAVFDQLQVGAQVLLPDDCYLGVTELAKVARDKGFLSYRTIEVEDTETWVRAAADADLIWLESPTNPLLRIADLKTICAAPRKAGSILGVDNTFATPLNQRPLDLGADVSIQSATKFIGGHSDLLAGVATTKDPKMRERLLHSRGRAGATPGALEAYLAVRGTRTMALRVARAQENAQILAERLTQHSHVEKVRYPGLPTHPGHELAREQLKGFGTIISFDVRGGADAAEAVCKRTRLIHHATSLGAIESTMERRGGIHGQEHLPQNLLRLSVGIENAQDLWDDLDRALSV